MMKQGIGVALSGRLRGALGMALAALLGSCSGAQLGHAAAGGEERWLAVDTPHFAISTNVREPQARDLAQALEEMRASLLALAWPGAKDPSGRTRVVVFTSQKDFRRYTGLDSAAGVAVSRPGFERLLSFGAGLGSDLPREAIHELAHDLSHWFLPLQPPWLSEGLASYLEETHFDRATQRATMGGMSQRRLDWLKVTKTLMATNRLFDSAAMHPVDPRESAQFYSAAWFLTHYLLNQQGDAFGKFQSQVARLVPWRQAWAEAFPGLSPQQLDAQLIAYSQSARFLEVQEPVAPVVFEPKVRPLPLADVYGARGMLAASLGNPLAKRELAEAARLDPNQVDALVVQFHALAASNGEARKQLAERAVAAHPEKADAWLLRALVLPPGDERLAALERARAIASGHPGVALMMAEEQLRRGQAKQAVSDVRLALRTGHLGPATLGVYVGALGAAQQCADAKSLAAGARGLLPPDCKLPLPDGKGSIGCGDYVQSLYDGVSQCKAGG